MKYFRGESEIPIIPFALRLHAAILHITMKIRKALGTWAVHVAENIANTSEYCIMHIAHYIKDQIKIVIINGVVFTSQYCIIARTLESPFLSCHSNAIVCSKIMAVYEDNI